MKQLLQFFDPHMHPELAIFVSQTLVRLILAAFLGGMIGLERESKRKAAGLRTNMFICFGAAMFTILSERLASEFGGDHTRIAAQIIPGIGFIGAGSILHSRAGVTGITTAATMFVVASIGMAVGGGLLLPAMFATLMLLIALHSLGFVETRWNLKPHMMTFEVRGKSAEELIWAVNEILESENRGMQSVQVGHTNGQSRLQFTVEGMREEHSALMKKLRMSPTVSSVEAVGAAEDQEE